jgi:serine protease Do
VRPFYFGRVDRELDAAWNGSLLRFSGLQQVPPPGAAIFMLDGRFVGLGTTDDGGFVVVPAAMLRQAAARLESSGSIVPVDLGLEVAALSPDLQLALGSDRGVVITHVVGTGPSQASLRAGDVIQRIGAQDVNSVEEYNAAVARLRSGEPAPISVRRRGTPIDLAIVPAVTGRIGAETSRQLGLDLRAVAGVGVEVVRVTPRSAAAIAGLLAGDVITAFDDDEAPTPAAIQRAFDRAADGARLAVVVQRAGDHHVLVLVKP